MIFAVTFLDRRVVYRSAVSLLALLRQMEKDGTRDQILAIVT